VNLYYQSFLEQIHEMMDHLQYRSAYDLINQELQVPYVPSDVISILKELSQTCLEHIDTEAPSVSKQKLMDWISGSDSQKEMAVSLLSDLNLRQYTEQVQQLLDSTLEDSVKGRLIEALMEQKIDSPFQIEKEGLEVHFIPSVIASAKEDPVLKACNKILEDWFSNDNPGFLAFCCSLLEQERLAMRPYDFIELEPLPLAKAIASAVFDALGQTGEKEAFLKKEGLIDVEDYTLTIEK